MLKYSDQLAAACYELDQSATQKIKLKASGEPLKFGVDTKSNARAGIMSLMEGTGLLIHRISLLGRDQKNAFAGIVEVIK